ncbi:FMN-binding protein [Tropicimonas isoalkanivorans]|uniref:Na(+)-translocating NADH-quinone reductase subunit C n=1 Tax=Tropicimonas isoalkanivorans TaxID=441112 RepID=A0A1I1QYC3_9RHOB|nr:FMN-binding protein [Tropicimonas isoalkanivorans]SFD26992.1 Na+-transporting NADH:ubiquinone oxidoreductase subunit C [Tropicimonas isoalkanivorans]
MADLSPISLWKRFLAQPIDSRGKTIAAALIVSATCALLVTSATVILRPIQQANRAAEQQVRLEALISAIPGMREVMGRAGGGALSTVVVDLEAARAAPDVTPETLPAALDAPENWTPLSPEQDMAMIGSRPNLMQVFFLRDGEDISLAILPIYGSGYNGPIEAMIALQGDMNTIAGLTVTAQEETPGLGARIEEPAWQASFAGKRIADDAGAVRFTVARGRASGAFEVDGITGATRTSNAMTRIVRFWVGPDGYGPLLAAIRKGEF